MHGLWHIVLGLILGLLVGLGNIEILFFVLGGALIDIDHLLYMMIGERIFSVKGMIDFHKKNFETMTPHFYALHFIEIIVLSCIVFYFVNWYLFLFALGMLFHWVCDVLKYIWFYRDFKSWIKYYSLVFYFGK